MATELTMLAWSVLLGFYIFATSTVVTRERGMKWNASARDGNSKPLSPLAGRVQRAQSNFLETFRSSPLPPSQWSWPAQQRHHGAGCAGLRLARVWSTCRCMPRACPTCAAWSGSYRCCRSWRSCSHL